MYAKGGADGLSDKPLQGETSTSEWVPARYRVVTSASRCHPARQVLWTEDTLLATVCCSSSPSCARQGAADAFT